MSGSQSNVGCCQRGGVASQSHFLPRGTVLAVSEGHRQIGHDQAQGIMCQRLYGWTGLSGEVAFQRVRQIMPLAASRQRTIGPFPLEGVARPSFGVSVLPCSPRMALWGQDAGAARRYLEEELRFSPEDINRMVYEGPTDQDFARAIGKELELVNALPVGRQK